jgi:MSHA biogenesis protein MshI
MFRRKQNSGLVAVRVHKDRVDVARVSRDAGPRPSVEVCTSYRREGEVGETLGRIRRELHLERFSCATLLSAGDYQLQVVEAPDVPEPEVKQAVRWRLKDVLDYPVEVATVDVLTVPPNPAAPSRSRSIFAVAARNEMIAARMGEFAQAKVPLAVIDIPEMAQRNLASLFELPGRGLAMLSFDDERGLLTFTADGELYLSRSIDVSFNQLLVSDADQKRQLFERIVLELQRSLDHFDRQFSSVPIAKVLIAPLPDDVGLETYLIENLYVPVEVAALDSVLDFENTPELANKAMQAQHFLGIGAALRSGSAA